MSDLVICSFRIETITFAAVLCKISPTPIARRPGFLSSGIKPHTTKGLMVWVSAEFVHRFQVAFSNALRRSLFVAEKIIRC